MLKTVSSTTNSIGALNYKGTWNANTNNPSLASGVGTKGDYYVVGTAGTTTLDGISNWGVGDWVVFNGSVWQRVEGGADLNGINLSVTGTSTLSGLTASTALALNSQKEIVSVTNTGTGNNVLATSPVLTTPNIGAATASSVESASTIQLGSTDGNDSYIKFQGDNINNSNGVPVDGWIQTRAFNRWFMYGGVNGPGWRTDGNYLVNQAWGGAAEFYFTANTGGVLLATGATSWAALSDIRLKNVIEPINDSLTKIGQIESFVYSFKLDEGQKRRIGVSAQSVQAVVPEAVDNYKLDPDDAETYLSVRYTELVPLLIAGIQDMTKQIDQLKSEIQTLKGA